MISIKPTELPDHPGEFIRAVRNDPALIVPLLVKRDPRLRYLFKKHKRKTIESASEEAYNKLFFIPDYGFNRITWLRLKETLIGSTRELSEKTGCTFQVNISSPGEPALPDAAFVLWLLQQAGISPHHCRRMLIMEEKISKRFGIPLSKRSPCDVLFYMHRRLHQHRGGAREIFHISRLWWIYTKNDEAINKMIPMMLNLTRASAQT
ncbi:MAG: hypothetical protein J7K63_02940 [Candidatus Marinimicrobia bacterium]|nr:hypothetical protein [Candidatus Neomarinimicrobiota bacterium]